MILETLYHAGVLAVDSIQPEAPPGSGQFLKLIRWLMWFVMLCGVSAMIYAGGKFGWEKWNGAALESPKMVAAAAVGGVIATSASSIMNAVVLHS
ncbi:hypothetical protein [Nocardia sp. BMG111209]|uniref:hypothetical protein n=1 Tax=Nocardia sp. BMG111209 TaxID=1160137 RepID=UPI00036B353C|nr:hypothetical protein [Nocardia sp. BMG111209]